MGGGKVEMTQKSDDKTIKKRKLRREVLRCVWCRQPFEDEYGNVIERAIDHYNMKGGCKNSK
jgi:hypothetical protein